MLAVIKTGGKQYLVSPGEKIKVEKLDKEEGAEVAFKEVLLVEKNRSVQIGTPLVSGAQVTGKVTKNGKGKKVIIFKYRAKDRFRQKKGHRQTFTEVEIKEIQTK
ncbi:MAG: 50S ribosomal protein L21 [Candidatus Pacebacteria bacterium]|nr:50S ribosomal protein L21 [Candidatus Paceibacterota bacterium]